MRILCFIVAAFYWSEAKTNEDPDEFKTFYLIPKTQKSCLPKSNRGPFRMPSDQLQVLRPVDVNGETQFSKVLAFPGCFEMSAQIEVVEPIGSDSVIMYHVFQWLQAGSGADVSTLNVGCTGADEKGCGGTGNHCYYCDVCETLAKENNKLRPEDRFDAECPKEVGRKYNYFEDRCINDWGELDKDKDGTPDFMKEEKYKEYTEFLDQLNVEGYGTMRLSVMLATNATVPQKQKMAAQRKKMWQGIINDQSVKPFQRNALFEKRWNHVHKKYWLPKMVSENLIGCVNVFFDMCKYNLIEGAAAVDLIDCPVPREGTN